MKAGYELETINSNSLTSVEKIYNIIYNEPF